LLLRDSKTLQLLSGFTEQEYKQFVDWLAWNHFNTNERLMKLGELLQSFHPQFDHEDLSKEFIHAKLFPGKKYKAYRVNNHLAYLKPLAEDFLAWRQLQSNEKEKEDLILLALEERNKDKLLESGLRKRRKKMQSGPLMDEQQYFHLYRTEEIADRFFGAKNTREKDESLQQKQRQLDLYYMTTKLRDACEMMNRQRIIQVDYDYFLVDQIMEAVAEDPEAFADHPLLEIYRTILLTFKEFEAEIHLDQLLDLLKKSERKIDKSELRGLYDYAKNYCIRKINSGKGEFLARLFEVFKMTIDSGVIYLNGQLSEWDYKNIVTVGTRLKEFEWTRSFIEEQAAYLPEKSRENAHTYNLAIFFYAMNDLDRTIELLRDVQFNDISYNLGGRITLIKAYYDADEHAPLLSAATSFKLFLKRSKLISPAQARVNYNLVRFTERLSRLRFKQPFTAKESWKAAFDKLKSQIEETPNIANKAWLMERVENLQSD
jgi:hypothetical protein